MNQTQLHVKVLGAGLALGFTKLLVTQERLKTMPLGDVWDEYCRRCGKPLDDEWSPVVEQYEADVLSKRS